ncbi:uncharacterized membrane protein YjgN (DUF898 family) [Acinetobacter calcoaceticus]|uniref:Uncharacterized membrane protein YjgN (DUF898 family) n=1 Tax=Acinetobacter calcoaceticus TaxID=471 RepID=A0A4R1XL14_ACICA|nr:uncharacterized membrane protein YjgN (DUF898 family) [Acinetobacter calcoaceticus]
MQENNPSNDASMPEQTPAWPPALPDSKPEWPPALPQTETTTLSLSKDQSPSNDTSDYVGKVHRFQFHGQAMEYFGIWIVNILLTIVTLSFYAPWAKVRRLRYFYQNSELFQRRFDFTGVPTRILVGRLIALGIWGGFALIAQFEPRVAAFGGIAIYIALPWLLRATLRFTSRNSKFGNSRFYFNGSTKNAYLQFILGLLIIIFTLGIFAPVMVWLYKRYYFNHLYVGQLNFKLKADWSSFMTAVYIPLISFMIITVVYVLMVISSFGGMAVFDVSNLHIILGMIYYFIAIYLLGWIFLVPLIQARIFIITWNSITLNNSVFKTDCNQWRYAWIVASNWILKIFSLGLLSAWAAIRIYRYQLESLSLYLNDDPDQLMNMAQEDPNAIAEEISDIFDLDISL